MTISATDFRNIVSTIDCLGELADSPLPTRFARALGTDTNATFLVVWDYDEACENLLKTSIFLMLDNPDDPENGEPSFARLATIAEDNPGQIAIHNELCAQTIELDDNNLSEAEKQDVSATVAAFNFTEYYLQKLVRLNGSLQGQLFDLSMKKQHYGPITYGLG